MTTILKKTDQVSTEANRFGPLLKSWREQRKQSQLKLSLQAGISQRHLSFLESGRAKPSREMVLLLGEVLEMPFRECNLLLNAAGFTASFQQRDLHGDEMMAVRGALDTMLDHHQPYPAIVIDKCWNLLNTNAAADAFIGLLGDTDSLWKKISGDKEPNVMRLTLHPQGLQSRIKNWNSVSTLLLSRLLREVNADPGNMELSTLYNELTQLPGIPENWRKTVWNNTLQPVLPLELDVGGDTLSIFSMISTFGTAVDITADELRVELFFPSDDFSERFLRQLAS